MRVAYITAVHIPAQGAQSLQIYAMAEAFGEVLGKDFFLVSPIGAEALMSKPSFQWKRIAAGIAWRPLRSGILLLRSLLFAFRFKPDLIYTRDIGIAAVYTLLGYKAVYEIHKPFSTVHGKVLFGFLSHRIQIVSISAALKEYVVTTYGCSPERVLVAHDGIASFWLTLSVSKEEQRRLRETIFGVTDDTPVALYAGSLGVGRGVEMILAAAKTFPDCQFIFIGASDKEVQTFGSMSSNVRCIPRQSQETVARCLRAADVLLIPYTKTLSTYRFMSPLKLFEYMASGRPIVASRLGSMVEVAHEENAFLFDSDDQRGFEKAIAEAVNNKDAVQSKTVQARKEVEVMTWTNRVRTIIDFVLNRK